MKKWFGLFVSLLLVVAMLFTFLCSAIPRKETTKEYRILLVQEEEKKEQTDPHMILILKEVQKKLDEWLKKLNDRIESEDITRFEVRFLEILRNILEWIKEKVDAKIESSEKAKPNKQEKGIFRETRRGILPLAKA